MSELIFDGDREYIGPYLRYLADQMGLRDWYLYHGRTTPQEEDHSDEVAGLCAFEGQRKVATIHLREDWKTWEEDHFRHICVHELLHCHFAEIRSPLDTLESLIGGLLYATTFDAMTSHMEYGIDAIAYDWGRLLPLPSQWLERATAPENKAA